jgi:hypothetical protein
MEEIDFKHECPEWDYLEITNKDPEFEACLCFGPEDLVPLDSSINSI